MDDIDPDDPLPATAVPAPSESTPPIDPPSGTSETAPPPIVEIDLENENEEIESGDKGTLKKQKSLLDFQGFTRSGSTSASQPPWFHAKDVTCHVCGKKFAHGGALYQHVTHKHPKSHEGNNEHDL